MSDRIDDRSEQSEGPIGDLELGAEQAEGVKGGAEPVNNGPKPAEPITGGKGGPPIKG